MVKPGDKQFRRSLKTKDRKLAERRLAERRAKAGGLVISMDEPSTFEDVAKRWMTVTNHALKPRSVARREEAIRYIAPYFAGPSIRNIGLPKGGRTWRDRWLALGFVLSHAEDG